MSFIEFLKYYSFEIPNVVLFHISEKAEMMLLFYSLPFHLIGTTMLIML